MHPIRGLMDMVFSGCDATVDLKELRTNFKYRVVLHAEIQDINPFMDYYIL